MRFANLWNLKFSNFRSALGGGWIKSELLIVCHNYKWQLQQSCTRSLAISKFAQQSHRGLRLFEMQIAFVSNWKFGFCLQKRRASRGIALHKFQFKELQCGKEIPLPESMPMSTTYMWKYSCCVLMTSFLIMTRINSHNMFYVCCV